MSYVRVVPRDTLLQPRQPQPPLPQPEFSRNTTSVWTREHTSQAGVKPVGIKAFTCQDGLVSLGRDPEPAACLCNRSPPPEKVHSRPRKAHISAKPSNGALRVDSQESLVVSGPPVLSLPIQRMRRPGRPQRKTLNAKTRHFSFSFSSIQQKKTARVPGLRIPQSKTMVVLPIGAATSTKRDSKIGHVPAMPQHVASILNDTPLGNLTATQSQRRCLQLPLLKNMAYRRTYRHYPKRETSTVRGILPPTRESHTARESAQGSSYLG